MNYLEWLIAVLGLAVVTATNAASFATKDGTLIARNWGYQLQGPTSLGGELRPQPLASAPHDLLVIDFARFGDEATRFTPAEVRSIQNGPYGRRAVAAYVSIGEASEFRSYWDATPGSWTQTGEAASPLAATAPTWLGPVNPAFPESRKVRYWDATWQSIVFNDAHTGWVDQVVDQGFDAAYLDIVDAYFFWASEVPASERMVGDPTAGDERDAAERMIDFIVDLTAHARETNNDFFVIPQNGEFILDALEGDDPQRLAAYLDAAGAIGIEDTYFRDGDLDENNAFAPDEDKIAVLQRDFLGNGIPVLTVDYVNDPEKVAIFEAEAVADGFIPYAAPDRDLDGLGPAVAPVPAPASFAMLPFACLVLARFRRRARYQPPDGNHITRAEARNPVALLDAPQDANRPGFALLVNPETGPTPTCRGGP